MKYLVFIILLISLTLILIISQRARPLAKKYRELEEAHTALFSAFKRCHEYLLKTYPDLDTREYLEMIENQSLKERVLMEMDLIIFDDQMIIFKNEFKECCQTYHDIYDQYQKMVREHPLLTRILNGLEYEEYRTK